MTEKGKPGRKPTHPILKKQPYNTRLPKWLRDWLVSPGLSKSGPVLIEEAICEKHGLKPPEV